MWEGLIRGRLGKMLRGRGAEGRGGLSVVNGLKPASEVWRVDSSERGGGRVWVVGGQRPDREVGRLDETKLGAGGAGRGRGKRLLSFLSQS